MPTATDRAHRRWQVSLFALGAVTILLITGFIGWLAFAVGSVWFGGGAR